MHSLGYELQCLAQRFKSVYPCPDERRLGILLQEYKPLQDLEFSDGKSIAILPPDFMVCPIGCRYQDGETRRELGMTQNLPITVLECFLNLLRE